MNTIQLLARPRPPADLVSIEGLLAPDCFVPAMALRAWIQEAYLDEGGALFTHEHNHLAKASIGCLWTNTENSRHGRRIVGQAELVAMSVGRVGKWAKARSFQQIREWFGQVPDFLLTFDAVYADEVDDISFAALVDHELFHCAQAEDEFGQPKFNKVTNNPVWRIKGHDVEEFIGVVQRFGIQASGKNATEFVIAAAKPPTIGKGKIGQACGTCLVKRAA